MVPEISDAASEQRLADQSVYFMWSIGGWQIVRDLSEVMEMKAQWRLGIEHGVFELENMRVVHCIALGSGFFRILKWGAMCILLRGVRGLGVVYPGFNGWNGWIVR